jgi:hypothetical protein
MNAVLLLFSQISKHDSEVKKGKHDCFILLLLGGRLVVLVNMITNKSV